MAGNDEGKYFFLHYFKCLYIFIEIWMFVLLFFVGWWIFLIFYEKLSLVLEFMTGGQSGRYFKLFCSDWELCISTRSGIWSQYCWWERSNNVKDCWNNTRDLLLVSTQLLPEIALCFGLIIWFRVMSQQTRRNKCCGKCKLFHRNISSGFIL